MDKQTITSRLQLSKKKDRTINTYNIKSESQGLNKAEWKSHFQKVTHYMTSSYNILERQNSSNGEQIRGCQGLGLEEGCDYKEQQERVLG